ncbi:ankyrin repeat domain-containing protein [Streptomyces sp. NPDC017202]|uniref:ankyrin repeat domain-containing protein n=1 Tax=Streptomyces sp. NPDC017202 TaxID=3364981 RepID=UPI0037BC6777
MHIASAVTTMRCRSVLSSSGGEGGDFVALRGDLALGDHGLTNVERHAEQVDGLAVGAGSAHGLAVDGHADQCVVGFVDRIDGVSGESGAHGVAERVAVQAGKKSSQRGGVRRAGGQPELFAQVVVGVGSEAGDGGQGCGSGSAENNDQAQREQGGSPLPFLIFRNLGNSPSTEKSTLEVKNVARVLRQAAASGDAQQVAEVLASGVSPDLRETDRSRTALDQAVWNNHPDVVRVLLAAGSDPDAKMGEYHETYALRYAAPRSMHEVAQHLLDAGARPDGPVGTDQTTPLMLAAAQGDVGMVRMLLDRGASPNLIIELQLIEGVAEKLGIPTRHSPLSSAAESGHPETVQLLLERGARPDDEVLKSVTRGIARTEVTSPFNHRGSPEEFSLVRELIERARNLS